MCVLCVTFIHDDSEDDDGVQLHLPGEMLRRCSWLLCVEEDLINERVRSHRSNSSAHDFYHMHLYHMISRMLRWRFEGKTVCRNQILWVALQQAKQQDLTNENQGRGK